MFDVAMLAAVVALTAAAPTVPPPPAAPAGSTAASAEAGDRQRYCVVDTITGSRLPKRVCHSRSEWKGLGFDPLAAK